MSNLDELSAKRIGATLKDKWVLEELLGVGGMASVYAARHKIGRRDAIKILHPKVASSEHLRARFEQEAHAVNAFHHPGVVEIRDVDTAEDGAPFLVMELLEGQSLAQRLEKSPPIETKEIFTIAAQVLDVLAAAHGRGIIHRDIKPDNIFLAKGDGDGSSAGGAPKVKVLDFGIARVRSADKKALTTKAGITLGTMAYMAPEQARGEDIDGRADIYALGATMFRVLAGRFVHDVDSQAALVMRVIAHGAPRLVTVAPSIAEDVAAVVDRALAFELGDRYPDAATMLGDVKAVLAGNAPPWATTAPPIPERPRASALFDETPSQAKGKPTIGPRGLSNDGDKVATPATQMGLEDPSVGAPAAAAAAAPASPNTPPKPASMPTQISAAPSVDVPVGPTSERVVIVPSREGSRVVSEASPNPSPNPSASAIATVHGVPPPPNVAIPSLASPPATPANTAPPPGDKIPTPFADLSAFMKSGPSPVVLAIGGGVALLAIILFGVTIAWFSGSSSPSPADTSARAPSVASAVEGDRDSVPHDELAPVPTTPPTSPGATTAPAPPPPPVPPAAVKRTRRR